MGPAVGGLLVAAVGEGLCFLLNALSYVAVIVGLWMIRPNASAARHQPARETGALGAGVRYAMDRPELGRILALVGVVSAVAIPYRTFLPIMAQRVLEVGAWRYGLLMAAAGVGAGMGGALLAGLRLDRTGYRRLLPGSLVGFSLALACFALSRTYGLSLLLLAGVGCGGISYFISSNTLVQLSVEDAYRGRVMSLYTLMHQGTATFGSLALGLVANRFGTPAGLLSGAAVCLGAVTVFKIADARVPRAATAAPAEAEIN